MTQHPETDLPLALSADQHPIADQHISNAAHEVCRTLQDAGFQAYLVGGCVRDLLLDLKPKDFDVTTDAAPEQVRPLFRRSRIIGRRFKIVHVRAGREIVEVSTFRAHHSSLDDDSEDSHEAEICPDSGMLLRDNVYGNIEDDATRRDFTINSLFYDPVAREILDYTGGLADLDDKRLRVIGEPRTRFREDPVRMLRAMRFMAKLDFNLDTAAIEAIQCCREHCDHVPAARLFEEVLKLLMSGQGERCFLLLEQFGLFSSLFPATSDAIADRPAQHEFLRQALANTDARIQQEKPVTPAFLFAALLWPAALEQMDVLDEQTDQQPGQLLRDAAARTLTEQMYHTAIPKRFSVPMREIWDLHLRLIRRRRPQKLFEHPRFRAAYDFVLLREQAGEDLDGAGEWWTRFQEGTAPPTPSTTAKPRRRRRPRRRNRQADAPAS